MTRLQSWLSGLLVLQLLIAGGFLWQDSGGERRAQGGPLVSLEPSDVNRVVIGDGETKITLERAEGAWQMPEHGNLPVADDKISGMLTTIAELQAGWPVATTDSARQRFEVAAGKYRRRVQLYGGDEALGELYVGTSPGFRQSHIRLAGDDAVYTAQLNSYDMPVVPGDWLDKALVAVEEPQAIAGPGYHIKKTEDGWQWQQPDQREAQLNAKKAKELANAFTALRVQGIAEEEAKGQTVELTVTAPEGEWTYVFGKSETENKQATHTLRRSDREVAFTVAGFHYDRLAGVDGGSLVASAENENGGEEGEAPAPGADNQSE